MRLLALRLIASSFSKALALVKIKNCFCADFRPYLHLCFFFADRRAAKKPSPRGSAVPWKMVRWRLSQCSGNEII